MPSSRGGNESEKIATRISPPARRPEPIAADLLRAAQPESDVAPNRMIPGHRAADAYRTAGAANPAEVTRAQVKPERGGVGVGAKSGWRPPCGWPPSWDDVRRCPTLPHRNQCSTIGAVRLSFRVRNGTGRFPDAMIAVTLWR